MFRRVTVFTNRNLRKRYVSTPVGGESGSSPLDVWKKNLQLASAGNVGALCEVGWAHHQGLTPDSHKSLDKAIDYYNRSMEQGYAPAASLLGDIHYYDHDERKDWTLATKYLHKVIACTSPEEQNDAYVRSKALQKLGLIASRGVSQGKDPQHLQTPDRERGLEHFKEALSLCKTHFNCSWAFLLAHDPPGLWEQLENEESLLGNAEVLGRVMSNLVSTGQGGSGDGSALSQLQYYTRALRKMENDTDWVAQWQLEVLELFPVTSEGGDWGVTYFTSFLRIFMEPIVQQVVSTGRGGVPKVVSLGSGLGNIVSWPALAFGFRGVGLDVLPVCTKGATELYTTAVEAIRLKNDILHQFKDSKILVGQQLPDAGNSDVTIGKVIFDTVDVVVDTARVEKECADANVVWISDQSWPVEAQRAIEATAFASMPSRTIMVLYRPPHYPPENNKLVKAIPVATSWSPNLDMYIVYKE
jgi:hypothetical protein